MVLRRKSPLFDVILFDALALPLGNLVHALPSLRLCSACRMRGLLAPIICAFYCVISGSKLILAFGYEVRETTRQAAEDHAPNTSLVSLPNVLIRKRST
ncbi:hypothetical protein IWZ01DRAFT_219346 [Phyllosticta capitalensis]|uniref:Secreted protein n=1 Tax=Phyllosticta capitalensis TaxID=121624 RepID=A0ABR1YT38_9PEZI